MAALKAYNTLIDFDNIKTYDDLIRELNIYQKTIKNNKWDLGKLFELFTVCLFKFVEAYKDKFKHVWRYNDVPDEIKSELNLPKRDCGIDILLLDHENRYLPVQCKYKTDTEYVTWNDITNIIAVISCSELKNLNVHTPIIVTNCRKKTSVVNFFNNNINIIDGEQLSSIIDENFISEFKTYIVEYNYSLLSNKNNEELSFEKKLKKIIKSKKISGLCDVIAKEALNNEENILDDETAFIRDKYCKTFNLNNLNKPFCDSVGDDLKYIIKFKDSVGFTLENEHLKYYLYKYQEKSVDCNKKLDQILNRTEIIRNLLEIFFPHGIFDDRIAIVSTHAEHLTEKQKDFIVKYKPIINKYFPDLLQIRYDKGVKYVKGDNPDEIFLNHSKLITPRTLVSWLDSMLRSYFGFGAIMVIPGFNKNIVYSLKNNINLISEAYFAHTTHFMKNKKLDIEKITKMNKYSLDEEITKHTKIRKNKKLDIEKITKLNKDSLDEEITKHTKIRKNIKKEKIMEKNNKLDARVRFSPKLNEFTYYCYKLNNLLYLELLLNSNKNIIDNKYLNIIQENFNDVKCRFTDLHNCNTFEEILKKNTSIKQ